MLGVFVFYHTFVQSAHIESSLNVGVTEKGTVGNAVYKQMEVIGVSK